MSLLDEVAAARDSYLKSRMELEALIGRQKQLRDKFLEELDVRVVYAADWGGHTYPEIAKAAGYRSATSVIAARKRIEKREAGVR